MTARVECVVTSGVISSGDGVDRTTETNTWLVGDDDEVIVVDAGHDSAAILAAVGDRDILAVICTHGTTAHVGAALGVAERDEAPVALHPRDRILWDIVHPDDVPDIEIEHGGVFEVADERLQVLHTPGHTAGGVALHAAELSAVFTGQTLGSAGPGSVEGAHGDFPTLLTSIGERLLTLPGPTRVLPARGEETTIAAQDQDFDTWVADGGGDPSASAGA